MPATNEQVFVPPIPSIPEANMSEVIAFGSAYNFHKGAEFYWDNLLDFQRSSVAGLINRIHDPEWCIHTLRTNYGMIFARTPHTDDPEHLEDLTILRTILMRMQATDTMAIYRQMNVQYARQVGVKEYAIRKIQQGVSDLEWKAANAPYNQAPLSFETIRKERDHDSRQMAMINRARFQQMMDDDSDDDWDGEDVWDDDDVFIPENDSDTAEIPTGNVPKRNVPVPSPSEGPAWWNSLAAWIGENWDEDPVTVWNNRQMNVPDDVITAVQHYWDGLYPVGLDAVILYNAQEVA